MKTKTLIVIFGVAVLFGAVYFISVNKKVPNNTQQAPADNTNVAETGIKYTNNQYGFEFDLPDGWTGYSIVEGKWEGYTDSEAAGQVLAAEGPQLSIRHPLWTNEKPRQNIPIMVFTISQWDDMWQDKFHIGAAPINPSELGRNNKYVFALPARYNYAFTEGYEEVEKILEGKPLHAFDV